MNRAIIVHCWEGYPKYCWYPQTKKELEELGFDVEVPEMPETDSPKFDRWLSNLIEVVGEPDDELYLIGHSLGCITIMRYLETLKDDQKIAGAVFVAGFTDYLGFDEIKTFFAQPIDFDKIKTKANSFSFIHSDNDPYVDLKYGHELQGQLGGNLIIKEKMGHFSGEIENEESCAKLPEIVEEIEKMMQNK